MLRSAAQPPDPCRGALIHPHRPEGKTHKGRAQCSTGTAGSPPHMFAQEDKRGRLTPPVFARTDLFAYARVYLQQRFVTVDRIHNGVSDVPRGGAFIGGKCCARGAVCAETNVRAESLEGKPRAEAGDSQSEATGRARRVRTSWPTTLGRGPGVFGAQRVVRWPPRRPRQRAQVVWMPIAASTRVRGT